MLVANPEAVLAETAAPEVAVVAPMLYPVPPTEVCQVKFALSLNVFQWLASAWTLVTAGDVVPNKKLVLRVLIQLTTVAYFAMRIFGVSEVTNAPQEETAVHTV
jgi:hypothetical protein